MQYFSWKTPCSDRPCSKPQCCFSGVCSSIVSCYHLPSARVHDFKLMFTANTFVWLSASCLLVGCAASRSLRPGRLVVLSYPQPLLSFGGLDNMSHDPPTPNTRHVGRHGKSAISSCTATPPIYFRPPWTSSQPCDPLLVSPSCRRRRHQRCRHGTRSTRLHDLTTSRHGIPQVTVASMRLPIRR